MKKPTFLITKQYDGFVLITMMRFRNGYYVSDKQYYVKDVDTPFMNDNTYNLFNILTDFDFKNRYIQNAYTILKDYALFIDDTILKTTDGTVMNNTTGGIKTSDVLPDIRKEIREYWEAVI